LYHPFGDDSANSEAAGSGWRWGIENVECLRAVFKSEVFFECSIGADYLRPDSGRA